MESNNSRDCKGRGNPLTEDRRIAELEAKLAEALATIASFKMALSHTQLCLDQAVAECKRLQDELRLAGYVRRIREQTIKGAAA